MKIQDIIKESTESEVMGFSVTHEEFVWALSHIDPGAARLVTAYMRMHQPGSNVKWTVLAGEFGTDVKQARRLTWDTLTQVRRLIVRRRSQISRN